MESRLIDNTLLRFVDYVPQRPAMYGVNRVEELALVIMGFEMGRAEQEGWFEEFEVYIKQRLGVRRNSKQWEYWRWPALIRFYVSSGNDAPTLAYFRRCFEEFCKKNNLDVPSLRPEAG